MSAPTLHPAARLRPVLLERLERQHRAHYWAALVLAGMVLYLRVDNAQVPGPPAVGGVLLIGFALAAAAHEQPVWDAALPVDRARYALVRLVCGVVWAAFILAVVVGLYAALFGDPEYPRWYPLAIFGWGLTAHLLASASFLGAADRAAFLVYPVLCLLCGALLLACMEQPDELARMGVTAVLARTALLLGVAGAAAYVNARFPGRGREQYTRTPWWNPAAARENRPAPLPPRLAPLPPRSAPLPSRPARPPVRRAGLARPSAALIVFRQHFALLRRYAIVPALTLLVLALVVLWQLVGDYGEARVGRTVRYFVESTGLAEWCVWLALSWAVLVWLAERNARRRWNDTLPVGTAKRRILHAAAGAAWLILCLAAVAAAPVAGALAAGTLHSPADVPAGLWLGLPCMTLTLYLAPAFVFFGLHVILHASFNLVPQVLPRVLPARTPLALGAILMAAGMFGVPYLCLTLGMDLVESQARVLVEGGGSAAAATLRLVLLAPATAGAVALSDGIRHLQRLPTVREVRGLLHEWAGTRPGPPLPGHAGR